MTRRARSSARACFSSASRAKSSTRRPQSSARGGPSSACRAKMAAHRAQSSARRCLRYRVAQKGRAAEPGSSPHGAFSSARRAKRAERRAPSLSFVCDGPVLGVADSKDNSCCYEADSISWPSRNRRRLRSRSLSSCGKTLSISLFSLRSIHASGPIISRNTPIHSSWYSSARGS